MIVHCAYDELVNIDDLQPNPDNNNRHSIEQIDRLCKIIDFNGVTSPITISKKSGFITRGHARLEAFKKLGYEKVPVQYIDYRDEAHEYSDLTADNEIARWAELDKQAVYAKLEEFPDFDVELLGIEDFQVLDAEEIEPERIPGDIEFAKEIDQKNDYIVLLFTSKEKYAEAREKLGLGTIKLNLSKNGNPNMEITGTGRVINGEEIIDRL
jgi:hypothetical protein